MDEERRIRFLVAPALFVASLLIGALSDPAATARLWEILKAPDLSKSLIELAAGGGVVVFAGGYVFGTFSYFFLRLIFCFRPFSWGQSRFHEVELSDETFRQIWDRMNAPGKPDRSQELYAGAAFDFDVLRKDHKGVHQWLVRRWNGFNIAANSIWALILSLPFGFWIGLPLKFTWGASVLVFGVVLGFVMVWAWRDAMHMLGFMASLEANKLNE